MGSTPTPGCFPQASEAHDPRKDSDIGFPVAEKKDASLSPDQSDEEKQAGQVYSTSPNGESEATSPVAPDQFDPEYTTGKYEIWSYYSYYIGNNGLSLFNFAPTAFQNLLYQSTTNQNPLLYFAGGFRTINSIVLLSNGVSFALQTLIFLLGAYADFGSWRPNILIFLSLCAWGIGFGWLGVHDPDKWQIGCGLYIVGLIGYQTTLTFWTAAFPGLARNTVELRDKAEKYERGEIFRDEYDYEDSLMRSRLQNMAFYIQSLGEVVILAIIVGIMWGVNVDASVANNNWGLSVLIAFATGVWVLLAIPWFWFEKRRPGLEPGMNIVLAGMWQLYMAVGKIWKLKQSLFYLIGYFLLGDSLNTTVTVIATLQNSIVAYNTLTLTYLLIVGIAAQAAGIYVFWFIQRRFRLGTKTMFNAVAFGIILLDGWGMIGNWTEKFGFHNEWEVWVYQAFYGLFVCPWYSYSQIMISEGKTSSFIGPLVSSAIIDRATSNNLSNPNSTPFYFLFALSCASFLFLFFCIDLKKSRLEQEAYLRKERDVKEKVEEKGVVEGLVK